MADLDTQSLLDYFKRLEDKNRKRPYRCKLVSRGNSTTLMLVWPPGSSTEIHDHVGAHVRIDVYFGTLYRDKLDHARFGDIPRFVYGAGDRIEERGDDIHQISNGSLCEWAVSVHVYEPPFGKPYMMRKYPEDSFEPVLVDGDEDTIGLLPIF